MNPNDTHKLIQAGTGIEITSGETVTDFRSELDVFRYISRAPGGNSGGKITTDRGELYPSVFGLTIVPRTPEAPAEPITSPVAGALQRVNRAQAQHRNTQAELDALRALADALRAERA